MFLLKKPINIINMKEICRFLVQLLLIPLVTFPVFAMNLALDATETELKGLGIIIVVIAVITVTLMLLNRYVREESVCSYISLTFCILATCLLHYRLSVISENSLLKSKVDLYESYYEATEKILDEITDVDDPIWSTDLGSRYLDYNNAIHKRFQDTTD